MEQGACHRGFAELRMSNFWWKGERTGTYEDALIASEWGH